MITLGIETSCDETALCLLETQGDEYRVLSNIIHSQVNLHKEYGGVVPMLAKREHIKNLPILYEKVLKESGISENQIDRIAVTQGPGLEPALWTGILFARELSEKLKIPLIPINHMEGHVVASMIPEISISKDFTKLKNIEFPALAMLISGGHTELVLVEKIGNYKIIGQTKDDAVGEAFDKVARMLGLPYPGGPEISKLAEKARLNKVENKIKLPRPMIHSKDLNFSFAGLKTAVLYTLRELREINSSHKEEIAREFEDSVTEVLVDKTRKALEAHEVKSLIIGGGVIANKHIRSAFEELASQYSLPIYLPTSGLSGDNALMIALVGTLKAPNDVGAFKAIGNLSF